MSTLDKGDIYFDRDKGTPLKDDKGGPRGPWLREFIEFGRMGVVQDRNTLIASYTTKPGTHYATLMKDKVQRASAAMFLMRWTDGTDGLFVNREPVRALPVELKTGDWWFIEDGDVYAAVRPLETTRLRGGKTILERRTRHVVLYEDNVAAADNIAGIADADWVQARSGFIVEMGSKGEYGSFAHFQDEILSAKVTADDADGFARHVAYERGDRKLDMRWHCYTEEYAARTINGQPDPWVRFLTSPEFAVNDSGRLAAKEATLGTTPGHSMWLLACPPSRTWVAYQPNAGTELPIDLKTPIAHVTAARFPFGKLAVSANADRSLVIDVDDSFHPFFGSGKRLDIAMHTGGVSSELVIATDAPKVSAIVNGIHLAGHKEERDGKPVWIVNPYDNARGLLQTVWPSSVRE
jgi:hypothetical protein